MQINYVSEINAFHMWLATNPTLSTSARILWFSLMHYCNSCGWKVDFAVPLSAIEADTGLKRDAIYAARNSLIQAGRIKVTQRKGGKAAVYSLIFFTVEAGDENPVSGTASVKPTRTPTPSPTRTPTPSPTRTPTPSPNIPRVEKSRVDKGGGAARARSTRNPVNDLDFGEVAQAFSDNINPITPFQADNLHDLYETYGKDRVIWAIREGARNNARSIRYVERVLEHWRRGDTGKPRQQQNQTAADVYEEMARAIPQQEDDPEKIAAWMREEGVDLDAFTKSSGHGSD